jgi:hypothetical protein
MLKLKRWTAVAGGALLAALVGVGAGAAQAPRPGPVDRDTARVRAATASFRDLDSAVTAGYTRTVARCIAHPEHGAMGYHHANRALMDDHVQVEHPEILVYSRLPTGEYVLNGVEYIVPFTARPRDARPPRVMGQALKPSDGLQLWYLHVWVWKENPAGLFADWNPNVTC